MRGRRRVFGVAARPARGDGARARPLPTSAALLAAALVAVGCGGTKQDAHEPSGSFAVEVLHASFPASQSIARPATFQLQVHNSGSHAVPDVAVTVDSFNYASNYPELAANRRPVWAIEQGPGSNASPPVESQEVSQPGSGQTAYVNTWALGRLAPGKTQTFTWRVVPVKAGLYTVHYAVAAGLSGKARATLASGGPATGVFAVRIAPAPPTTYVNPNTGRVLAGAAPKTP